jgi:hypothetical protein
MFCAKDKTPPRGSRAPRKKFRQMLDASNGRGNENRMLVVKNFSKTKNTAKR